MVCAPVFDPDRLSAKIYNFIDNIFQSPIDFIPPEDHNQFSIQTVEDPKVEALRVYWSYIQGMLINLGEMTLERMHTMLNTFVQAPNKFEHSPEELREFLMLMVKQEKVEFRAGIFKLKS